jgi:hypothetical protein
MRAWPPPLPPHRAIPSVERLLRASGADRLLARWRRNGVVDTIRLVLRDVRQALDAGGTVGTWMVLRSQDAPSTIPTASRGVTT